MNELLAIIKTALKVSGTALDTEITRHISAALKELERVGIIINVLFRAADNIGSGTVL